MDAMDEMLESKAGKWCVILYTLFTIGVYVFSLGCLGETCGLSIVWPILPWAFILASDLGLSFPWAMYPIFVLLNASVAYVLGAGVEAQPRAELRQRRLVHVDHVRPVGIGRRRVDLRRALGGGRGL